jgi:DNA-binding Xre family transcriptional regulator
MLSLNLAPIFNARGITKPHGFLIRNGFSNFTARRLINNATDIFRLEHMEKLCNILVCDPNDLLLFTPDKNKQYASNHPLLKLTQDDSTNNLAAAIATMPFKELKKQQGISTMATSKVLYRPNLVANNSYSPVGCQSELVKNGLVYIVPVSTSST